MLDSENRTVVILPNPVGGVWVADIAPGSVAIVRISARASVSPDGTGTGDRAGECARAALHGRAEAGQTVTFFEQADGELARLGSIRGGTGAIRYTVGEARSKARQIVAQVYQGRVPRARLIVARYSAANPPPGRSSPGAARGVPRGDSWTRAALGQTHFRARRTGTGLCLLLVATRGRTRVTFNGLARGEGLTVRVVARSPGGPPSAAP